jgi:hypothetical protein
MKMKKKIETFISENVFETFESFIIKLRTYLNENFNYEIKIIGVHNPHTSDTKSRVRCIDLYVPHETKVYNFTVVSAQKQNENE